MNNRALIAGLATLLLLGCGSPPTQIVPPARERFRPDLTEPLRRLEGGTTALSAWRGEVILVNFFSTDCLPCLAEIPELIRLHQEHQGRGFQVVGISLDLQGALTVDLLRERYSIPYPLLLASERMFRRETPFGLLPGLPMSFLLDRQGAVAGVELGICDTERVRRSVEVLSQE